MRVNYKTSDIKATIKAHIKFGESHYRDFGINSLDQLHDNEDFTILSNEGSIDCGPPLKTDFFSMILCLRGNCKKIIGPFDISVKPESIHLVSPRYITSYYNKFDDLKLYIILFKPEFLAKSFIRDDIIRQLLDLEPDHPPIFNLNQQSFARIKRLYEQVDEEYRHRKSFNIQIIRLIVIQILYEINRACEHCKLATERNQNRQANLVFRFKRLVDKHFLEMRTVQEFADKLHVSPKYLSEAIKKETGQNALNIIRGRLHLEAKFLLGSSDMSIKEISTELKFDTSSHFSRFFKQLDGRSPGQYQSDR